MASATAEKKPAAKKAAAKDEPVEAAPKKEKTATRPQRVSARITVTQTKVLESQFDTTSKKIEELDKKLAEVEQRFDDKPDHSFATAVKQSRRELQVAAEALTSAKASFSEIGETLRDFFG